MAIFKCDKCGKVQPNRTKMNKKVTETREVTYSNGGSGKETVTELSVCDHCK